MKRAIIAGLCCIGACTGERAGDSASGALPPVTLLSPDSAYHRSAQFSPDGSRLYWWEPDGLTNRLWTADSALGTPVPLDITSVEAGQLFWSPDGSRIAAPSSASGVFEIALLSASGEVRPLLGGTPAFAVGWNRDGDRLAYLASMKAAGGAALQTLVTSVSRGGAAPLVPGEDRAVVGTWSPDGSRIAYMVIDNGRTTIWSADSGGRHPRQLTSDGFESFPRVESWFSPDGSEVAYESSRTGTTDIWIAPLDSGPPRQLTRDIRNDRDAIWSPDGRWIAFISDRGKQTDIWIVPAAGGEAVRVTDDAYVERLMRWLPGARLAFMTGEGRNALWTMSIADGTTRQLTPDSMLAGGNPLLSPDGTQVAFLSRYAGNSDVVVMPTAGGAVRALAKGGGNGQPRWSPDGTRIAFISDRGGTDDVWVVEVASGALRQLTSSPDDDGEVEWNADGTSIYFTSTRDAKLTDVWQVPAAGGEPTRLTNQGSVQGLVTRRGRPELYGSILGADGEFEIVRIEADGTTVPIWTRPGSYPAGIIPSDSLVILEPIKGGGFSYRIIAPDGRGEGTPILDPGEELSDWSEDGRTIVYSVRNGTTWELALLDRATGAVRRLTDNDVNETSAVITPDGQTLVYERWRNVRRVAVADLSGVVR